MQQYNFFEDSNDFDEVDFNVNNHDVQRGDIFQLGRHRLMCGDSTSIEEVKKLCGDAKIQMVFTDPPWNVDYGGTSHPSWKQRSILNDKMSTEEFGGFLFKAFKAQKEVLQEGAMVYIVMSAQEWGNITWALGETGYHWSSTIIWVKDSLVLSRKDYHTQYEPIWYGWLDNANRIHPLTDRKQSDVWKIPRPKISEEHPTMKPVKLCKRAIDNSTNENDNVMDLFGGSGSTLIASELSNRNCYMMELDPKYCEVIINRYEKLTGNKVTKL